MTDGLPPVQASAFWSVVVALVGLVLIFWRGRKR